jgi:probable aminopeptidase NPEPL1
MHFVEAKSSYADDALVVVGAKKLLTSDLIVGRLPEGVKALWPVMLADLKGGDMGQSVSTFYQQEGATKRLTACVLPEHYSRHNSRARPHAISNLLRDLVSQKGATSVLFALEDAEDCLAASCAAARARSEFTKKTTEKSERSMVLSFVAAQGEITVATLRKAQLAAAAVQKTQALIDTPTCDLHTDVLVEEALKVAREVDAETKVIAGEDLLTQGLGGLWNVGKAAKFKPALVILSHTPKSAQKTVVWVGKGIVYDTGGLSLKSSEHMPGMKGDMGGAAAVLHAFAAAVKQNFPHRLHAVLCIAENAIGPDAMRPDDIITLYSGKTVEVNNTDAEGRLVLGDGLAYAVRHLKPDVIVDMATLTGAQSVATGKRHAAIVCNDEALEAKAVQAGKISGDLVHPIIYCPEFFRSEFKSEVADMKNSVKDRTHAPSSCAGQFLADQLGDYQGPWLHVDIASPASSQDRATGFGIGLLLELFRE